MTEPERPPNEWEARVANTQREGSWDRDPDDLPSPYSSAIKRRRFLVGFLLTLAAGLLLGALIDVLLGRPGSPWALDAWIHGLIRSFFPAIFAGVGVHAGVAGAAVQLRAPAGRPKRVQLRLSLG